MILRGFVIAAAIIPAAVASATVLNPGDSSATLTVFSDAPVLLASQTQPFSDASINGTVTSAVYQESGGMLDFYYQVVAGSGPDEISRFTGFNFSGYTTDVGYRSTAFDIFTSGGTVAATGISRNNTGSDVRFNFDNGLGPNETSNIFVIKTNATAYTAGNVAVINGISVNVPSFQPVPVPEPATIAGIGIASIAFLRKRRK